MTGMFSLAARAFAATACVSLVATPAAAASLPHSAPLHGIEASTAWSSADDSAANRRGGWGGGGWGGRHHHDDGIDAGDVFAGLLIIGGIAAIASAASNNDKDNNRDRDYRENDGRYQSSESDSWQGEEYASSDRPSSAIDRAVDDCAAAAERSGRVAEIYGVQRGGDGYRVSGRLDSGSEFACETASGGGVASITVDGRDAG